MRASAWTDAAIEAPTSLAFDAAGRRLAVGRADGSIEVWRLEPCARVAAFEGHAAEVGSLAFSPDGGTLYSGSADATILAWDVAGAR